MAYCGRRRGSNIPIHIAGGARLLSCTTRAGRGSFARLPTATQCSPGIPVSTGIRRKWEVGVSENGWRTTSTGRSRAIAIGAHRCRSGCAMRTTLTSRRSGALPLSSEQPRGAGIEVGFDPHKPYIDGYTWSCTKCSGTMRRVPQVIDTWFDSGSMPFAQWHFPFENREVFERHYPADFIAEGVDQTRGWFYSLLAIATGLGDALPAKYAGAPRRTSGGRPRHSGGRRQRPRSRRRRAEDVEEQRECR